MFINWSLVKVAMKLDAENRHQADNSQMRLSSFPYPFYSSISLLERGF